MMRTLHSLRTKSWVISAVVVVGALALGGGEAKAQFTWNQAGSGNWSSASWLGGTPAAGGGATVNLNFNGTTTYIALDDLVGAYLLNQLNFNGTGAGTTITVGTTGSATGLTFAGLTPALVVASTDVANVVVSAAATLSAATAFTNNGSGTLTYSGAIAAGTNTLTFNGTGTGSTLVSGGITFTGSSSIVNSTSGSGATTIGPIYDHRGGNATRHLTIT